MMLKESRAIRTRLMREGWTLVRIKGSHHVFHHPTTLAVVVVPHPKKDLPIGTVRSIYRQAGWVPD